MGCLHGFVLFTRPYLTSTLRTPAWGKLRTHKSRKAQDPQLQKGIEGKDFKQGMSELQAKTSSGPAQTHALDVLVVLDEDAQAIMLPLIERVDLGGLWWTCTDHTLFMPGLPGS